MAYVTGSAASMSALLSALQGACTANGWTLSGNVLHKGSCYAEVLVSSYYTASGHLSVCAGNGIDGSNNLTDRAPNESYLGALRATASGGAWVGLTFPLTYNVHVHASTDEVWLLVNYDTDYWQWLSFGQIPAPGNLGTGNYHCAPIHKTSGSTQLSSVSMLSQPEATSYTGSDFPTCIPFAKFTNKSNMGNGFIHGVIDASTGVPAWCSGQPTSMSATASNYATSMYFAAKLWSRTPNAWSNEAVLVPIQIAQMRASSKLSLIAQMKHARYVRNDFIEPGAIITLGIDKWKVYPCFRRDVSNRDGTGTSGGNHSGTMAIAVRYDGP